jgi:hypothetical protein
MIRYLDFVCKDAEIISQDSRELLIIEVAVWHVAPDSRERRGTAARAEGGWW